MWKLLLFVVLSLMVVACAAELPPVPVDPTPTNESSPPSDDRVINDEAQTLPFEIIERADGGRVRPGQKEHPDPEPDLLVITSQEDVEKAKVFISEEAEKQLAQTNFTTHFAILIFWGWHHRLQEGRFQLETITRQDDKVILVGIDGERPAEAYADAESSPYHLIRVPRQGEDWGKEITFNLYFDQSQPPVASVSHYVE